MSSRSFCFQPPDQPTVWALNDFWQIFESATNASLQQALSTSSTLRVTCTEESVFVWIPSLLLVLISLLEWNHIKTNARTVNRPWTVYLIAKYVTGLALLFLCLFRSIYWLFQHDAFSATANVPILDSIVPIQADLIRALSLIYMMALGVVLRRRDYHSSISIFVYLSSSILLSIYSVATLLYTLFEPSPASYFRSPILLFNDPVMLSTRLIYIVGLCFLFFLVCLTDRQEVSARETLREKITNPEQFASFASQLSFEWLTSLIMIARRVVAVQMEHLWVMSRANSSETVTEPFERELNKNAPQKISVVSLVTRLYWPRLLFIGIIKLIASLFIFVNPIVLDWLIDFMKPDNIEPLWKGFFYCSLMFVSPMIESILTSQHEYQINLLTMHIKICLTECIYSKSFKLANVTKMRYTTGEIVNLLAVDTQRVVEFVNQFNVLWSAPMQILIGLVLLWQQLGIASLAGFSYMVLIIPINLVMTRFIQKIQQKMMVEKDQRSKLMNEILNGIKVIKLNAWSEYFYDKVSAFRSKEIAQLRNYAYMNGFMTFFFSSASFFVALFSFLTFVMLSPENVLNPNRAFVSLALFNIIRIPLAYLPMLLSAGGVALVSIQRINQYLNSSEMDPSSIAHLDAMAKSASPTAIKINGGNFAWSETDTENVLEDVNVELRKGELIAVVGGVGSGKSSLLASMLGEMVRKSGQIEVNGRLAYVPQEAWIRNATIRENIILDQRYDARRYKAVIEACSLKMDFALFENDDLTEVGEKGINLSGGQKQRISLARAVYSGSDIFLFDDPLSALDAHVSKHIFDGVIGPEGSLKKKTRILVTHKLSLLTSVDNVIFINRGRIVEYGPFSKLMENKGAFSEYVAEYFLDRIQDKDETDEAEKQFMDHVRSQIEPVLERLDSTQSRQLSMSLSRQMSIQEKIQSEVHRSQSIRLSKKEASSKNAKGKLIQAETMAEGSVSLANHGQYFKTIGICTSVGCVLALIISNVFQVLGSLWLTEWSNDSLNPAKASDTSLRDKRLAVYAVLGVFETVASLIGTLGITLSAVKASRVLHNEMLAGLMSAPMSFFDTTPMGRILNRFTRDVDVVDLQISVNFRIMIMQIFRTFVSFGLISLETPIILALILPLTVVYYIVQRLYIDLSRQLKRIEAVSRSPINNCLSETVSGATSIRTYGLVNKFTKDMHKKIDTNNQSYWLNFAASRWLAVRLEFLSYTIVFVSALFAVLSKGTLSPGIAGLAISYSLNITSILNLFIRGYTDTETNFVSVERLVEYMNLPRERQNESALAISPDWPQKGEIILENYSTQYRPGLPLCLKRLNATFRPGSKIAVVGRTGSGKSSLALSLFRIIEPVEGTIRIDNVDVRSITQRDLRASLSIVPQDPVLFTGTLRSNVDLRGEFSDKQILDILRSVNLKDFLDSIENNLDYQISGTVSESLSAGQKQLICLSRAMIRHRKVVVFDEATALVDYETDLLVHQTIFSNAFKDVTVIMIAHRLDHILDYDYVLVMKNGEIQEFENPNELAKNENSAFYAMAKEAKIL